MKNILSTLLILVSFQAFGQSIQNKQAEIQQIVEKSVNNKNIFGLVINVSTGNEMQTFSAGNMNNKQLFFTASVTKLYTSAIILKLHDEGKIHLEDKIAAYLSEDILQNLHIYKGKDYAKEITILHLLTNTSGIPDYFEGKYKGEKSIMEVILHEHDTSLSFNEMIAISKRIEPHFVPGKDGKALYADTNFQLLGKIIEKITKLSIAEAYKKYIFDPLALKNTYLFNDIHDTLPAPIYYKKEVRHIPEMMASFRADGGIVTTAEENTIFLEAFYQGRLFSKDILSKYEVWNKIFTPFHYGLGQMKFKMPGTDILIGHSGASGSFAFYVPEKNVYLTGTINQVNKPGLSFKILMKILKVFS